jgi:hypothetical protein
MWRSLYGPWTAETQDLDQLQIEMHNPFKLDICGIYKYIHFISRSNDQVVLFPRLLTRIGGAEGRVQTVEGRRK